MNGTTSNNNNGTSDDYAIDEEVNLKSYVSSEGINGLYSGHLGLEYNTVPISTVVEDEERVHRTVAVGVNSTAQTAKKAKESYGYESNTSDEEYPLFPTEIISNRNGHSESNIITAVNSDAVPLEEMVVEAMFLKAISRFYDAEDKYQSKRDCVKEILMTEQQIRSESTEEDNNDSVLVGISSNILVKEEEILCRIAFP
jgi:hypothetical protein